MPLSLEDKAAGLLIVRLGNNLPPAVTASDQEAEVATFAKRRGDRLLDLLWLVGSRNGGDTAVTGSVRGCFQICLKVCHSDRSCT